MKKFLHTSRIVLQKSTSSAGILSQLSFGTGHFNSKTNFTIDPSPVMYSKGRFCHTSSAKCGKIGAINLTMVRRCAARTVWQLLLVKLAVPLKNAHSVEEQKQEPTSITEKIILVYTEYRDRGKMKICL